MPGKPISIRALKFLIGITLFFICTTRATADTVDPAATLTSPNLWTIYSRDGSVSLPHCASSSSVTALKGMVEDDDSGVAFVFVQILRRTDTQFWNGAAWQTSPAWVRASLQGTRWSLNNIDLSTEAFYDVRLNARDHAGNVATGAENSAYRIRTITDVTDPTGSTVVPDPYRIFESDGSVTHLGSTIATGLRTLLGDSEDDNIGTDLVFVQVARAQNAAYWNGTDWQASPVWVEANATSSTWRLDDVDLSPEGDYRVRLNIRDKAGNVATSAENPKTDFRTIHDTVAPTGMVTSPAAETIFFPDGSTTSPGNTVSAGVIDVTGTALDNVTEGPRVLVQINTRFAPIQYWNKTAWQNQPVWIKAGLEDTVWTLPNVDFSIPGGYRIKINLRDRTGNITRGVENPITNIRTE